MHAVAHDVIARQVGAQHKAGVRAVEDAHLALLVGGDVRHHHDVHAGPLEGQPVLQAVRALDDPHAEHLAHVGQRVLVAVGGVQALDLLGVADAAGHDAVHQRGAEGVLLIDPLAEVLGQLPVVDVLVDALLQLLAVVVDQLAGEDHQAGFAGGEALVQHAGQLRREAVGRNLVEGALGIVNDAGLGGVGNDDLQVVAPGQLQHLVPLGVGVQAAADGGDDALLIHLFAVLAATQVQRIQSLLVVDVLGQALGDGLHQHHLAVPVGLLVGDVKEVVHECPQEVAFAELHDLLRRVFQDVAVVAGIFQNLVIQQCHIHQSFQSVWS